MMEENKKHGARQAPGLSPWARYKAWLAGLDRGSKIRFRILQAAVVLALAAVAGYAALSAWIKVPEVPNDARGEQLGTANSSQELPEPPNGTPSTGNGRKDGVYTFLVAGRDVMSGSTDTMLLVSYNTVEKTVFGLNLPRDTMVNVSTASKRLNAVYSYNRGKDKAAQAENGMAALKEEVAKLTGIIPDFYVVVEWEAVGELVDALGGVEFEVPFNMDYDDPYQNLHIHQKAGLRVLSGDDAMQVIRHRKNNDGSHSNGDVGRLQVQQDFLRAVAKKCLQPSTLLKIPSLAQIFLDNVKTDLTIGNIIAFAQLANGMDAESGVDFETAPLAASFSYNGASMVTLDGEKLLEIVNEELNPYTRQIKLSDLELLYRKSNGSFGVTSGTLVDSGFSRPYVPQAAKPAAEPGGKTEETEGPQTAQPGDGQPADGGQTGADPGSGGTGQTGTDPGSNGPGQTGTDPGSGGTGQTGTDPGSGGTGQTGTDPGSGGTGQTGTDPGLGGTGQTGTDPGLGGTGQTGTDPGLGGTGQTGTDPGSGGTGQTGTDPGLGGTGQTDTYSSSGGTGPGQVTQSPGAVQGPAVETEIPTLPNMPEPFDPNLNPPAA